MTRPSKVELPEGWALGTLGAEIALDLQTGFACGNHSRDDSGVAHLRPMNVSEAGRISLDNVKYVGRVEVDREERWLRAGDVVFNNTNSPELVGKTALYDLTEPRAYSNHMTRVRCRQGVVTPGFVALHLHHLWRKKYFEQHCSNHVSQASVSRAALGQIDVPVPPLAEQKRIVEKVEALLAEVQQGQERLERLREIIPRIRQSIVTASVVGRLTADWRENTCTEGSARQVDAERSVLKGGKPGLARATSPGAKSDWSSEGDWQVPTSWYWASLGDLLHEDRSAAYGVLQPGPDVEGGVPFVRIGDLVRGTVATDGVKRIEPAISKRYPRTLLQGGELLVSLVGTIGRVAVAPASLEGANVARAIGVFPLSELVDPTFVRIVLEHAPKQDEMADLAREVARKTLNLGLLKEVRIPVPPRQEQAEIVLRVAALTRALDVVELAVDAAVSRCASTPGSVLAKAFAGDLVPTEAELARAEGRPYESGEMLLARIRAAGAGEAAEIKSPRRRRGMVLRQARDSRGTRGSK